MITGDTKYYLSGPMSRLPELNYPLFEKVAKALREEQGFTIFSPHEITAPRTDVNLNLVENKADSPVWAWYVRRAIEMQLKCDAIILLPGWTESRGARREFDIALDLKFELFLCNGPFKKGDEFWTPEFVLTRFK